METGLTKAGRIWRSRAATALLLFVLLLFSLPATHAEITKEYQIKAAFLYNFVKFVEWPTNRFATASTPIRIGVLGKNPFGDELQNVLKSRTVRGRDLEAVVVQNAEEAADCHLLFITAPPSEELAATLRALAGKNVLTVGENEGFIQAGGMINFILEDDKVRFQINAAAAERESIKLSAQLQKLARTR